MADVVQQRGSDETFFRIGSLRGGGSLQHMRAVRQTAVDFARCVMAGKQPCQVIQEFVSVRELTI